MFSSETRLLINLESVPLIPYAVRFRVLFEVFKMVICEVIACVPNDSTCTHTDGDTEYAPTENEVLLNPCKISAEELTCTLPLDCKRESTTLALFELSCSANTARVFGFIRPLGLFAFATAVVD